MSLYPILLRPPRQTQADGNSVNCVNHLFRQRIGLEKHDHIHRRIKETPLKRVVSLLDEMRYEEKSLTATSSACCGALFAAVLALLSRSLRQQTTSRSESNQLQA